MKPTGHNAPSKKALIDALNITPEQAETVRGLIRGEIRTKDTPDPPPDEPTRPDIMRPDTRALLLHTAFLPMARTIDSRAQYYLRKLDAIQRKAEPPSPPLPRWRVALEALAIWTVVLFAVVWLCFRWGIGA